MTGPACAGKFDLFERADQGDRQAQAEALTLCRERCPVLAACLEVTLRFEKAQNTGAIFFIAGGMTPTARAALLGLHLRRHDRHPKKATTSSGTTGARVHHEGSYDDWTPDA